MPEIDYSVFADKIRKEEGFRDKIYVDSEGKPTIGYGFKVKGGFFSPQLPSDVVAGKVPLSREKADAILLNAMPTFYTSARNVVGPDAFDRLSPNRKMALIDMVYQMGVQGVSGFDRTLNYIRQQDFPNASREMLDSDWARQTPNRAKRNSELMRLGLLQPDRAAVMGVA